MVSLQCSRVALADEVGEDNGAGTLTQYLKHASTIQARKANPHEHRQATLVSFDPHWGALLSLLTVDLGREVCWQGVASYPT